MAGSVIITENGRSGGVRYAEWLRSIEGSWEFGGGDVVAIVSMGSRTEWERAHPGMSARRAEILRYVAAEVIRQRAPSCTAEIDDESGDILLRERTASPSFMSSVSAAPSSARAGDVGRAGADAFVRRYQDLRSRSGLFVIAVALVAGGVFWAGQQVLLVEPASGVPLGECIRTETHIASLIQATDPHLPRWSGRGGDDTSSIRILLIPLDGTAPRVVPVAEGLTSNSHSLARILGSDGHTLWFDVAGIHGVRLRDDELVTPEDLREANPAVDPSWWEDPRGMDLVDGRLHVLRDDRSAAVDVDPASWKAAPAEPKPSNDRFDRRTVEDHLAAGFLAAPDVWLGLHSPSERAAGFESGSYVREVESAEDAKQLRRLHGGKVEAGYDETHHRIREIESLRDDEYLNAAFLRMDPESPPLRLRDPDGALMIHTSAPGLDGTLIVSRVDLAGRLLWSVDTGLDRFLLQQILPGPESFAFVGSGPPIPDVPSEPFVVLIENATGKLARHSLWR